MWIRQREIVGEVEHNDTGEDVLRQVGESLVLVPPGGRLLAQDDGLLVVAPPGADDVFADEDPTPAPVMVANPEPIAQAVRDEASKDVERTRRVTKQLRDMQAKAAGEGVPAWVGLDLSRTLRELTRTR